MGSEEKRSNFKLFSYVDGSEVGMSLEALREKALTLYDKMRKENTFDKKEIERFLMEVIQAGEKIKKPNTDKKHYFITYQEGDFIGNTVIDYHPIRFLRDWKEKRIIFYKEISKVFFEEFLEERNKRSE